MSMEPVKMTIPINPMGTVRTTRGMINRIRYKLYQPGDKKVEKVIEYLDYKNYISTLARTMYKDNLLQGPIHLNVTFHMPMPASWSEKKKREKEGKPHTTKPDRDNLEKGVCDSLNKIVWKDDGQVCDGSTTKVYSRQPRIEIEIMGVSS